MRPLREVFRNLSNIYHGASLRKSFIFRKTIISRPMIYAHGCVRITVWEMSLFRKIVCKEAPSWLFARVWYMPQFLLCNSTKIQWCLTYEFTLFRIFIWSSKHYWSPLRKSLSNIESKSYPNILVMLLHDQWKSF